MPVYTRRELAVLCAICAGIVIVLAADCYFTWGLTVLLVSCCVLLLLLLLLAGLQIRRLEREVLELQVVLDRVLSLP